MNLPLPKNPQQPPFRPRNLLTKSDFVRYCDQLGLKTSNDELEFFEEEQIFFPAIRVDRGYAEMRKAKIWVESEKVFEWRFINKGDEDKFKIEEILPETFYSEGGFFLGQDNWLDYYIERKMYLFPCESKFVPHSQRGYPKSTFVTDVKDLGWLYEDFYNKHQVFTLSIIQRRISLKIVSQGIYRTAESWEKLKNDVNKMFDKSVMYPFIKQHNADSYKFIAFFEEVEDLAFEYGGELSSFFKNEVLKEKIDKKEAQFDLRHHERTMLPAFRKKAVQIFEKNTYTKDDIKNSIWEALSWGSFGTGSDVRKSENYVRSLDENILIKSEEPYKMAHFLSFFLWLLGDNWKTVNELILHTSSPPCIICLRSYIRKRVNQVTCGNPVCQKEYANQVKRRKRKSGEYNY